MDLVVIRLNFTKVRLDSVNNYLGTNSFLANSIQKIHKI